ncbi:hypothetical protein TNCV_1309641 [Trichonephila clavipes]|nr:hypothetical protein TNCV_1309641 [Trichonephila clavipes]
MELRERDARTLSCCDFGYLLIYKRTFVVHSEEEINVGVNAFFNQLKEMYGFRRLICGKFVYKSGLILEETTLITPKIFFDKRVTFLESRIQTVEGLIHNYDEASSEQKNPGGPPTIDKLACLSE